MTKHISTAKARKIASDWHGGQWSALYQFASSGVFVPENYSRYSNEINAEIERETEYHSRITKKQSNELWQLRKYFEYKRNENVMKNIASINGRKRIWQPIYVIQEYYSGSGWEDVNTEITWTDAKRSIKEYRENMPQYPHRIVTRKERIEEKPIQHQYVKGSYYTGKGIYRGVENENQKYFNWLKFQKTGNDVLPENEGAYNYEPNYQGIHGIGDDLNPKKPLGWFTFIKNTMISQDDVSPQPKPYKAGTFVWGLHLWGKDNSILTFQDTPESKQKYSTTTNTVKPGKLKRAIMNRRSSNPVSPAASPASPAGRGSKVKSWFAKRPVLKKVAKAAIILSPTALTALAARKAVQKIKSRKAHQAKGGIMTIASTNPDNAIM